MGGKELRLATVITPLARESAMSRLIFVMRGPGGGDDDEEEVAVLDHRGVSEGGGAADRLSR